LKSWRFPTTCTIRKRQRNRPESAMRYFLPRDDLNNPAETVAIG
jgi:hypothetical protein